MTSSENIQYSEGEENEFIFTRSNIIIEILIREENVNSKL